MVVRKIVEKLKKGSENAVDFTNKEKFYQLRKEFIVSSLIINMCIKYYLYNLKIMILK